MPHDGLLVLAAGVAVGTAEDVMLAVAGLGEWGSARLIEDALRGRQRAVRRAARPGSADRDRRAGGRRRHGCTSWQSTLHAVATRRRFRLAAEVQLVAIVALLLACFALEGVRAGPAHV